MTRFVNKQYLRHDEDLFGYPNMSFERFYQQGLLCGQWRLPRNYIRQAYQAITGKEKPHMWQVRAFLHGLDKGRSPRRCKVGVDYVWPVADGPDWLTLICLYPDGKFDLDFTHRASRAFWSEFNPFPELPDDIQWQTLEALGFEIMHMYPVVSVSPRFKKKPTLQLVH